MATNLPGKVVGDDALGLRLEHKTIAESGDAVIVLDQLSTLEHSLCQDMLLNGFKNLTITLKADAFSSSLPDQ